VKNFLTVTLLSLGVPMFVMGDEVRRTQSGNNNAYCQDNVVSWFDWSLLEKHADLHRFVSLLNARRLLRDVQHEHQRLSLNQIIGQANKTWHGVRVGQPDWTRESHSLAFEAVLEHEQLRVYIVLNAYWEPLDFELPPIAGLTCSWRRWIDTSSDAPLDIFPWNEAPVLSDSRYRVAPRSVVVFFEKIGPQQVGG
jgi:isoamylase